jgi:polysaccharide biosynthesis protein PslH
MKIFVLLSRFPYPLDKGDKLRAFHQIKALSKKHEIFLCALSDIPVKTDDLIKLKSFCTKVEVIQLSFQGILLNVFKSFLTGEPLQKGYFFQYSIKKRIQELIRQYQPDHVYCQLLRTASYLSELKLPKTLDFMDALSKGMERRIDKSPLFLKSLFSLEAARLKRFEHKLLFEFSNKTIITEQDRDFIDRSGNFSIKVIPNGVDTDFFIANEKAGKDFDLVFIGNMNYPPNIESAEYLVKKILPLIHQKLPGVRLLISGASPSKRVKSLASEFVSVSGWVDDIRTSYSRSKVFIAPMRIGSGLQNKILEAMAMKIPCITSELANNALGAAVNSEIFIGNTPNDYAEKAIELLKNENLRDLIAEKAYHFVLNRYSWEKSTELLDNLFRNSD